MRAFQNGQQYQFLSVADLTAGGVDTLASLASGKTVEVVYSDPPWNPGNEKFWRRMAGANAPKDYGDLLRAWCRATIACAPRHIFVEQSVNEAYKKLVLDAIASFGAAWHWPLAGEWVVQYGSPKRPNALLHFGFDPIATDPTGMHGVGMTRTVFRGIPMLSRRASNYVADPCMGLGTTSRVAHEFGMSCLGTELNERRLGTTIARLTDKLGYEET